MLLKNCRIVGTTDIIEGDILINGEKIVGIGSKFSDTDEIDIKKNYVIPGLVDIHVHMRDFKNKRKEDFYSGSRAAIAGGVTTFIDMPNSNPPVTDIKTYNNRLRLASQKSIADFGLNFGVTKDNQKSEIEVEPMAYKIYMDNTLGEIDEKTIEETIRLRHSVAIHAEEPRLFIGNKRPASAEVTAVKKIAALANKYKKKVHICHVSSQNSLNFFNKYISSEVTPHHLLLTEKLLKEFRGFAKTHPPLRRAKDTKALWHGLKNGDIQVISSDHAPHEIKDKEGNLDESLGGMSNLDVMLKLFLTLVNQGRLTLPDLVRWMSHNPARILNIKSKGLIKSGMDADLVILDMKEAGKIDVDEFFSKAKYSPFDGQKVTGCIDKVILRGRTVYEEREIISKKGYGRPIIKSTQ
tara:strand:+ start:10197 stop:11423 length:1227 start_codon:yes stop_codon:yes gene_type:complete